MHELLLRSHPDSESGAAARVAVRVSRPHAGTLTLSYLVNGKIGDISIPTRTESRRSDGLWRHTCFEAFVGSEASAAYYEFNFSPSTQWAAYRFSGYRAGMCEAPEASSPSFDVNSGADNFMLQASLQICGLSALARTSRWRLGLSAVIEHKSGHKSHWALAHPPGKPDFHHADCFAYEFSPAEHR